MKLYFSKGACSLAVRIIINELGLKCDYESVDLKTKKTASGDDFLKINSKGAVPVLITEHNEVLTENAVIQQYLADSEKAYQLLPAIGELQRYRVLEWLNYISTELHKTLGALFNPQFQSIRDTVVIPLFNKKLDWVNNALQNKTFLLGDQFTLPDAYLFVILLWMGGLKLDLQPWPNLVNYYQNLKNHASVKQALRDEGIQIS